MIRRIAFLATILAGFHMTAMVLAQGYGEGYRRMPRWQRPYEYDRPAPGPFRDRGLLYPEERRFNEDMRRFRRFEGYRGGPYRPY